MSTSTEISINEKLKSFFEDLDDTYDEIADKTGITRSVLFKIVKPGATVKSDYIEKLVQVYGLDPTWLFPGGAEKRTLNQEHAGGVDPREDPDNYPQHIQVEEPLTAYQLRVLRDFEKKVDDLVNRIERGPLTAATKVKLIDSLLRIVENDLKGDLSAPREPDPDTDPNVVDNP